MAALLQPKLLTVRRDRDTGGPDSPPVSLSTPSDGMLKNYISFDGRFTDEFPLLPSLFIIKMFVNGDKLEHDKSVLFKRDSERASKQKKIQP